MVVRAGGRDVDQFRISLEENRGGSPFSLNLFGGGSGDKFEPLELAVTGPLGSHPASLAAQITGLTPKQVQQARNKSFAQAQEKSFFDRFFLKGDPSIHPAANFAATGISALGGPLFGGIGLIGKIAAGMGASLSPEQVANANNALFRDPRDAGEFSFGARDSIDPFVPEPDEEEEETAGSTVKITT